MKQFKGKAIYNPSGKAGEYSYWACNFYVGCSNGCTYCYCKKGILASQMGGDIPTLKKCFNDENHALDVFEKELMQNLAELQQHGLFFTFTSDPMLPETIRLTKSACSRCVRNGVPIKILTKRVEFVPEFIELLDRDKISGRGIDWAGLYAIGFTLTGHDELEPNASTNAERIEAMMMLHEAGFKTWASIEPIVDVDSSLDMIMKTQGICDLYKVGLMSGAKYDTVDLCCMLNKLSKFSAPIYVKDSFLKTIKVDRSELPSNFVDRNYNLFSI